MKFSNKQYKGNKFAVVTNCFPPVNNGQSIVIGRLTSLVPDNKYIAIVSDTSVKIDKKNIFPIKNGYDRKIFKRGRFSAFLFLLFFPFELLRRTIDIISLVKKNDCDLLIVCTGDIVNFPASTIASKILSMPIIYYVFDDYVFCRYGIRKLVCTFVEKTIINSKSVVVAPNEVVASDYKRRYDVNVNIIRNAVDVETLKRHCARSKGERPSNVKQIVYAGSIYRAHYDSFGKFIEVLNDKFYDRIFFNIYSDVSEATIKKYRLHGRSVACQPKVDEKDVAEILASADGLFLPLAFKSKIDSVLRSSAPLKMGEYLATGVPVLVVAPAEYFVSKFFQENKCGIVVTSVDDGSIEEGLNKLLSDSEERDRITRNAISLAEREFALNVCYLKFIEILNNQLSE